METTPLSDAPARATERGAAIVEFALVSVVLFTIIFGLIEGGLLVRARNAIDNAADDAARRGAIAADDSSADWQMLQQLRARGILSLSRINHVVIFRATDSSAEPNATCLAGTPVAGECNVYDRSEFELPSTAFDCSDPELDASWCPSSRAIEDAGFQYVGIYIDATHRGLTGVFGEVNLLSQAALPIEGSGGA